MFPFSSLSFLRSCLCAIFSPSPPKKCSSLHPLPLHSSCVRVPDNLPLTTFPREHRDVTEQRFRAHHAGQPEGVAPVTAYISLWCDSPPPLFVELVRPIAQSCRVCVQESANQGPGFIQRDTHTYTHSGSAVVHDCSVVFSGASILSEGVGLVDMRQQL